MHKLLERQLRRLYGGLDKVPAGLKPLLDAVESTYAESDADRLLLERSLELTSQELVARNEELRREIDRLARMQAALSESEHRYRQIVETAAEGIWVLGPDGETTFLNARMAEMLGYTVPEMLGRPIFEYMEPQERPLAEANLQRRRRGIQEQHDFRFQRKDGRDLWAIVSTSPILDPTGQYKGALKMITDITERRQTEEDLRRAYRQLEEAVKFKTQFLNNAAHELATPMTPMILQARLLHDGLKGSITPVQQKGLEILARNIQRLSALVNDVLDAARIQSLRLRLDRESADVTQVVEEAVESFRELAQQKSVRLNLKTEGQLWASVDARRLNQVMFNLLSNAIKFTPAGGTIDASVSRQGPDMFILVRDSGVGIVPENMPRLFQPFSQVSEPAPGPVAGTGLGLYVSKGIVEEHGGEIWCESAGLGHGCTFRVRIPFVPAPRAASEPAPVLGLKA